MLSSLRWRLFVLLFGWSVVHAKLAAQSNTPFSAGITTYYGFAYRHSTPIGLLTQGHPRGAEVYLNQLTTGAKQWHQWYQFPQLGLAAGMMDFRSVSLGKVAYGLLYLDKSFLRPRTSGLRLKIGWGPGIAFKPFHPDHNFQNVALSSRLNYALRGELYWLQRITPHWQLKSGLMLTHFSNGAFKMPNSGINVPAWSLGIRYLPHPQKSAQLLRDTATYGFDRKITLHLSGAFTLKETFLPGGRKFPGGVVSVYLSRQINRKSALSGGLDATFNSAVQFQISKDTTLKGEKRPDYKRVAFTLGHELQISSRLALLTQLGVYVYKPYKTEAIIYQRYGLKYYFWRRFFGAISLKSHFGTADFVEWTAGVKLR